MCGKSIQRIRNEPRPSVDLSFGPDGSNHSWHKPIVYTKRTWTPHSVPRKACSNERLNHCCQIFILIRNWYVCLVHLSRLAGFSTKFWLDRLIRRLKFLAPESKFYETMRQNGIIFRFWIELSLLPGSPSLFMLKLVRGSTSDHPPVTKSSHVVFTVHFSISSIFILFFPEIWGLD